MSQFIANPARPWQTIAFLILGAACAACDSTEDTPDPEPPEVQEAQNIEADPVQGRDPVTGRSLSFNRYTLFDLETGAVTLSSNEGNPEVRQRDSSATNWDVGFRGTTIIVNGGSSGPRSGSAQIVNEIFASIGESPESGYITDGENDNCPMIQTPAGPVPGSTLAICTGSDNGWYNYNPSTNIVAPIPGRTILLRTAEGNYAKMRILSYYKDSPSEPTAETPSRYYSFQFVVQTDGSRNLGKTTVE